MTTIMSNLDDKVRESLRDKILAGNLGGGAHLSELKISKEFNVSRTPVREALCALAADGLVEMVPHRGAFVKERTGKTLEDTANMYGYLMGIAARIATQKAGIEALMELETAINGMNGQDAKSIGQICQSVNSIIRTTADSSVLENMIISTEKLMEPGTNVMQGSVADIYKEYTFLLGAFKRRKADAAEKTMRQMMVTETTATETTGTVN